MKHTLDNFFLKIIFQNKKSPPKAMNLKKKKKKFHNIVFSFALRELSNYKKNLVWPPYGYH